MSNYSIVPNAALTATADAIRTKSGSQATIEFDNNTGFKDAVNAIPSGGGVDTFAAMWKVGEPYIYENSDITELYLARLFQNSSLESISLSNLEDAYVMPNESFGYVLSTCLFLKKVYFPKLRTGTQTSSGWYNCPTGMFWGCTALEYADSDYIGGRNTALGSSTFSGCSSLKTCDFRDIMNIAASVFYNCTSLNMIVFRNVDHIAICGNINAFNGTPFASGGTGGTVYVPDALISSYQSATNWSTILGYTNNQIKSIESTHTDPNAPIDLTLYYADGTPIPTT